MSRRLLQRGRYPKGSYMQPPPTCIAEPQQALQQPPVTSEVPFYNVQPAQQGVQNTELLWQQQSFGATASLPSTQSQQLHPQSGHMHGVSSYSLARPPENNVWDWTPNNGITAENNSTHLTQHTQYQQFNAPYQQQYQQPENNTHLSHPPPPPTNVYGNAEYIQQNSWYTANAENAGNQNSNTAVLGQQNASWDAMGSNISQPEHLPWIYNMPQNNVRQNVNPSTEWPASDFFRNSDSYPVNATNYNKVEASNWPQGDGSEKNKFQDQPINAFISQPESTLNCSVESTVNCGVDSTVNCSVETGPSAAGQNTSENELHFYMYGRNIENLEASASAKDCTNVDEGYCELEQEQVEYCEQEQANGALGAFFSDSIEENIHDSHEPSPTNSVESRGTSVSSGIGERVPVPQTSESEAGVQRIDSDIKNSSDIHNNSGSILDNSSGNVLDVQNSTGNAQISNSVDQACNSFHQMENSNCLNLEQSEGLPLSPSLSSIDEPLNQEVPDPNDSYLPLVSQANTGIHKDLYVELPDEPLNQQIPVESDIKKSTPEIKPPPERLIAVHREGSPFKPLTKLGNSASTVVQQEVNSETCPLPVASTIASIGIQEVNLETFPDNLERPPDHDELLRQRHASLYRHHLRDHTDASLNVSSTHALWESPDIPCITLAPAAPLLPTLDKSLHAADLTMNRGTINVALPVVTSPESATKEVLPGAELQRQNTVMMTVDPVVPPNSSDSDTNPIPCVTSNFSEKVGTYTTSTINEPPTENLNEQQQNEQIVSGSVIDCKSSSPLTIETAVPEHYRNSDLISVGKEVKNDFHIQSGHKQISGTNDSKPANDNSRENLPKSFEHYKNAESDTSSSHYRDAPNARPPKHGAPNTCDSPLQSLPSYNTERNLNSGRSSGVGHRSDSRQNLHHIDHNLQGVNDQFPPGRAGTPSNVYDEHNSGFYKESRNMQRNSDYEHSQPYEKSREQCRAPSTERYQTLDSGVNTSFHADLWNKPHHSDYERSQPHNSREHFLVHDNEYYRNSERDGNTSSHTESRNKLQDYRPTREKYASLDSEHYPSSRKDSDNSRSFRNVKNKPHHSDYEYETSHYKNSPRSMERGAMRSHHQVAGSNFSSFEDRTYSDREGSRPSSRMSLNEPREGRAFYDYSYHRPCASDYERSPSRTSEPEPRRPNKQGSYPYYDPHVPSQQHREREDYYRQLKDYKGYDYDPYRDPAQAYYGYYDPYRYGYSNYNYGFYDELYRNNPRYRQQMEDQYREYYRTLGYDYDRMSSHSGRSSANELSKDTSSRLQDTDRNSGSECSSYSQRNYPYEDEHPSVPSTRLTPAKFSSAHPFGQFSNNGLLISLRPKLSSSDHTALLEIYDMQVLMESLPSHEELKNFQGPLIRGETHKNGVIDFCLQKVKFYKQEGGIPDRESYILLWELLVLLLRQNGSVAGSDIAELLLKDHEVLRPPSLKLAAADTPLGDRSPAESVEPSIPIQTGDASSPDEGIVVTRDRTILNAVQTRDIANVTRKFREFLLFGHKKDALEWAMKHDLWGHALFLASKMDWRTHANIMTRFANSLALNDPLQTLYQQMSGRQPAAVTCIVDKHWGDWRPHLAMILSNPSAHPEVDSRSVTTLGDTLAAQGCLPAAHFCYIMAQVEFGHFTNKSSKLVLLGADHRLAFDEFATNEAIQCTEIYEYAQSLANPGFLLNHLQCFKFIYATRLIDHGFFQEALHYCEILSSNFITHPGAFSYDLMTQVYEISCKLKYYDPHYLQGTGEWEDQEDPEWLRNLNSLILRISGGTVTPADYGESVHESTTSPENLTQESSTGVQALVSNAGAQNQNQCTPENQQVYYPSNDNVWNTENSMQPSGVPLYDTQANQSTVHQYQGEYTSPQWNVNSYSLPEFNQENREVQLSQQQQQTSQFPSPPSPPGQDYNQNKFDFHGTENQQPHLNQSYNRERTSSTSSMGFQSERKESTRSSNSEYGISRPPAQKRHSGDSLKAESKEVKPRPQVGRSWLGGIFSKLLPKAPNQMILPDDKNPAIIWDENKKCWINNDSDGDEASAQPVAPPTDVELMTKSPPEMLYTPQMPSVAAASTPATNKFQRPKVKGMRQNYVDILNDSKMTPQFSTPSDALFPSMPLPQSSANLFVPSMSTTESAPTDFVSRGEPQCDSSQEAADSASDMPAVAPLMFDPAEFDSRRSGIASLRHSVGPARRTYPT